MTCLGMSAACGWACVPGCSCEAAGCNAALAAAACWRRPAEPSLGVSPPRPMEDRALRAEPFRAMALVAITIKQRAINTLLLFIVSSFGRVRKRGRPPLRLVLNGHGTAYGRFTPQPRARRQSGHTDSRQTAGHTERWLHNTVPCLVNFVRPPGRQGRAEGPAQRLSRTPPQTEPAGMPKTKAQVKAEAGGTSVTNVTLLKKLVGGV